MSNKNEEFRRANQEAEREAAERQKKIAEDRDRENRRISGETQR